MVQTVLPLKKYQHNQVGAASETAAAVGLRCEDQVVTLRFMASQATWGGQPARQVRLDRKLAEQLARLLADELDDYA